MKVLTAVLTVMGCGVWLGYALLAALVADIEGGDGGGQLPIAVAGVAAIGAAAVFAARDRRGAATLLMLSSAVLLVLWLSLLR